MSVADPTLTLFERLADESLWHIVRNVPVFCVNTRQKGGKVVKVDAGDLRQIADNARTLERRNRVLSRLILGHSDPDAPEWEQPDSVGYARNWRLGTYAGKPTLFIDEWHGRDSWDEAKKYPFRSVEYDPRRQDIPAVALLKRPPELALGMMVFGRSRRGTLYCYSREANMADPTMPPDPNADPNAGAGDKPDAEQLESYMRHCATHPYAREHHERMVRYAAEAAGAGPGVADATDASIPGAAGAGEQYARGQAERYTRLERENKGLKTRLAKLERENRLAKYKDDLAALKAEHDLDFDLDEELQYCSEMTPVQFQRHCERIPQYGRGPTGGPMLRTAAAKPGKREVTREESVRATRLAASKGIDFDSALAQVRADDN